MKSCVFFGHGEINYEPYRDYIKKNIIELIEKANVTQFYSGGRGSFDRICSEIVGELKEEYLNIKNTLVYSYIPKGKKELAKRFDDTVYLLEENVPPKYAIIKTNEKMVEIADYVLVWVCYSWGGARRAFDYAVKKGKRVINLSKNE